MGHVSNIEFNLCCQGDILYGFPQGDRFMYVNDMQPGTVKKQVSAAIAHAKTRNKTFVVATLSEDQKTAAGVLVEMGFRFTPWMNRSKKDKKRRIRIYYKDIT